MFWKKKKPKPREAEPRKPEKPRTKYEEYVEIKAQLTKAIRDLQTVLDQNDANIYVAIGESTAIYENYPDYGMSGIEYHIIIGKNDVLDHGMDRKAFLQQIINGYRNRIERAAAAAKEEASEIIELAKKDCKNETRKRNAGGKASHS